MSNTRKIPKNQINENKTTNFSSLPNPDGVKLTKYFFNDLFIGYIGLEGSIDEITILQKETDQFNNTVYYDLISKTRYKETDLKANAISIPPRTTLLSKLNTIINNYPSIEPKHAKEWIRMGYLTDENIIDIYNFINCDLEYKNVYYSRGDGPVYYNCPNFCLRHKNSNCIPEKDDKNLTQLIISLTTSNKIIVLTGKKGIGKSILKNKLNYFKKNQTSYFTNKDIWTIDYESLNKKTFTKKHREKRIDKTIEFLEDQPDSILFIDNVDLNDNVFIKKIIEQRFNKKVQIVLIARNKIDSNELDKDIFSIIEIQEQKEETKREILKSAINFLKEKTSLTLSLNTDEQNQLINILLNSDQTNIINNNFDNNPKLAKLIIENAFKITSAFQQSEVTLSNFILGLDQENINMAKDAKEKTKEAIITLEKQVEKRKLIDEENKEKTFKEKVKNLFQRKK